MNINCVVDARKTLTYISKWTKSVERSSEISTYFPPLFSTATLKKNAKLFCASALAQRICEFHSRIVNPIYDRISSVSLGIHSILLSSLKFILRAFVYLIFVAVFRAVNRKAQKKKTKEQKISIFFFYISRKAREYRWIFYLRSESRVYHVFGTINSLRVYSILFLFSLSKWRTHAYQRRRRRRSNSFLPATNH